MSQNRVIPNIDVFRSQVAETRDIVVVCQATRIEILDLRDRPRGWKMYGQVIGMKLAKYGSVDRMSDCGLVPFVDRALSLVYLEDY